MRNLRLLVAALALTACRPSTIAEAEAKHDVRWLDEHGTPDAVAAVGRLADHDETALAALDARSAFDVQAFVAAWAGVTRGAPWSVAFLRRGLADPKRADLAASALPGGDPLLVPFASDLEDALVRIAAGSQTQHVASALASIGPKATDAVARRLVDPATRGAMCRGIASRIAAPEARHALIMAPESARDAPSCVDAVVHLAAEDDAVLEWMADHGEPGLLGAAGRTDEFPCSRLHVAWARAIPSRPPDEALTVPLAYAAKRCAAEMDGVLADALARLPAARSMVVSAIDPFGDYGGALRATCAALPAVASGTGAKAIVRERASDTLNHACKPPA